MTEVESVRVYPIKNDWVLRIKVGEPFAGAYVRVLLGKTRSEAFNTLLTLYPSPFESLDQLTFNPIELNFNTTHTVHGSVSHLETPVRINNIQGTIGEPIPRFQEHKFDKKETSETIQTEIETKIILYREIPNKIKTHQEVKITDITPQTNNIFIIHINSFTNNKTLPVKLTLPSIDNTTDHPITNFIKTIGSGKIKNIENKYVYIYPQHKSNSVIGEDTYFNKYGISANPVTTNTNTNRIKQLFQKLPFY
jgi:hypothetical protein